MENIYCFEVDSETIEKINDGTKTAHLFVNLQKYKPLSVGNEICFVAGVDENKQQVDAVIDNILYFSNVTEAIESIGKEKCGFKQSQTFDKASDLFLSHESYEQIEKYGIGAILFSNIKKM